MLSVLKLVNNDIILYLHETREYPLVFSGEEVLFLSAMNITLSAYRQINFSKDAIIVAHAMHPRILSFHKNAHIKMNHSKIALTRQALYVSSSNLSSSFFLEATLRISLHTLRKTQDEILHALRSAFDL